jgi:predicted transcriptional regulator
MGGCDGRSAGVDWQLGTLKDMKEKYTTAQMIEALREKHGNLSAAARFLGCSRETVRRYISTYSTVQAVADEERETLIDFAENQLFQQVKDGNITAIIFTLKTIGKSRGYVERQEVTGADGGAVLVKWDDENND